MTGLNIRNLSQVFLRSYLIGACFNPRGLQNVGLAYAIDPGLKAIHAEPNALQQARKRALQVYNTHPYWTPLLLGVFLYLEKKIAKGLLPAKTLPKIKTTTVYTLSAVGDSFFGGSLFVFWSLTTVLMLVSGLRALPLAWGISWFLALQIFRIYTFHQGLVHGLAFLSRLREWNLINAGRRIKILNALVLVAIWVTIWPWSRHWAPWCLAAIGLPVLSLVCARHYRVREFFLAAFLGAALLWPLLVKSRLGFDTVLELWK